MKGCCHPPSAPSVVASSPPLLPSYRPCAWRSPPSFAPDRPEERAILQGELAARATPAAAAAARRLPAPASPPHPAQLVNLLVVTIRALIIHCTLLLLRPDASPTPSPRPLPHRRPLRRRPGPRRRPASLPAPCPCPSSCPTASWLSGRACALWEIAMPWETGAWMQASWAGEPTRFRSQICGRTPRRKAESPRSVGFPWSCGQSVNARV